jgi:prepilin-type N-terminal cleavage/methylation domain-containing protein
MDRPDFNNLKPFSMKNNQGFSLIELLIAIALLSIGLLALFTLQSTAIRGNLDSKELTTAVFLSEKKMEELKNTPFDSLTLGSANDANNPINGSGQGGGIFNRSWTIQSYSGSSRMKRITVSIAWTLMGNSHSTSMDTVVAR